MKRWVAITVSVGVIVLTVIGVRTTTAGPEATLVGLSSDPFGPETTTGSKTATSTSAPSSTPSSTMSPATTTTIPPRAQPVRLPATGAGPLLGAVIVVDPGHNGRNFLYSDVKRAGSLDGDGPLCNTAGSSTNAGLDELTINWAVGTRLATLLRDIGADVIMTHPDTDGFGPCADERGAIARDAGATAFVSIHADGSSPGDSGFHIIHPAPSATLDPAQVAESARLADLVRDEMLIMGGRPATYVGSGGVHERGDLANLNTANRPAVLAELGNLKNGLDATMLSAEITYQQIARGIARALVRFVGRDPAGLRQLGLDVTGDGLADLLPGAPQATLLPPLTPLPTSVLPPSTTSTTAPSSTAPPPTLPPSTLPPSTQPSPTSAPEAAPPG